MMRTFRCPAMFGLRANVSVHATPPGPRFSTTVFRRVQIAYPLWHGSCRPMYVYAQTGNRICRATRSPDPGRLPRNHPAGIARNHSGPTHRTADRGPEGLRRNPRTVGPGRFCAVVHRLDAVLLARGATEHSLRCDLRAMD